MHLPHSKTVAHLTCLPYRAWGPCRHCYARTDARADTRTDARTDARTGARIPVAQAACRAAVLVVEREFPPASSTGRALGDGRTVPDERGGGGGGPPEGGRGAPERATELAGLEALTQQIEWLENTASSVLSVEEEHTASSFNGPPGLRTITLDTRNGHVGITVSNAAQGPGVQLDAVNECDIAYKAGLRQGDVILAINERPVDGHAEAIAMIDSAQPGPVAVTYYSMQGGAGDDGSIGLEKHDDGSRMMAH